MKVLSHFESKGNIELLSRTTLAVFASQNTPRAIYPQARELFQALCQKPLSLCGGWQAPLERELLNITNPRMAASIIFYSARDISIIKHNQQLKALDMSGKLLVISAESRANRISKNDVVRRDDLLFKQTDKVLFMFIERGGQLEKYYNKLIENKAALYILDHPLNKSFITSGSIALNVENMDHLLT